MPSIEQIVAQIRTAIFGRDVRENIAEGIETCYTDVTNGVTVANTAANKITNMTVSATNGNQAGATITEVDGHKHISFTLPKGDTGDAFHIVKTYASISAMNADYSGTDVHVGEYVMIVSNVEDPDNAKVYIKGSSAFNFVVDMSGSAGIQGQAAYVHIRYASAQPTQDSDMKTTADNWMGIYSGTSSTAPSTYTSYTWFQIKGAKGDTGNTGPTGAQTYVYIRYSENEPTQDSDMKTTPDAWMGIFSGTSSTAPTTYNSYTWYNIKGTTGNQGPTGADAHVYIRYSANQPTQDSDMKATADAWMGIYSGTASTAPTTYTSYTWYKIRGEDGAGVITTIQMNGNALPIVSGVVDLGVVLTDPRTFVASQQDVGDSGKALGINSEGKVVPVPFSGDDFTGATASTAGVHGYVPAPSAGDQMKVLLGGGTWGQAPGARVYTKEITVTNSSGSYSQTFVDENITADMKAVELEYTRSYVFGDVITVTPANGSITIACNDVAGTDTIKISLLKTVGDPSTVTSSEFDILANRIGTLSSLDTTVKTNIVSAVNEVKGAIPAVVDALDSTSTTSALSAAQGKELDGKIAKQRYSKEYSTSSVTLAQIQSDADALAGNELGIYDVGYLNGTAATAIGVGIGACFVQLIKHSAQRQMLLFTSINSGQYAIVSKYSSTWESTFENPIASLNSKISKYDATSWIGNVTSIDTLNALTTPGRYRYYINISGVGLESGWSVVDVAALSGYDNYQQTITFAGTGNVYTRMHSTGGTWGDFASLSGFTAVTFTPESGITNALFIRRNNRTVVINGYLQGTSAFGSNQFVGTIENGHRPSSTVRFLIEVASAAYEPGDIAYGAIGTDGKLSITAKTGNTFKNCYFSVSYIV